MKTTTSLQKSCTLLFFCSGIPALFYQIVWQRSLFSIYGVNIESITMVVMGFMFGLGLGSLLGGWLSKAFPHRLLQLFALFELSIGIFGFCSLTLFHWVGLITLNVSTLEVLLITFVLVCIPTLLMGASLPLLTAYIVRHNPNVGRSVSTLYFANTLGSAIACFIAAIWAMKVLGQSGTVSLAASINLFVGIAALLMGVQREPRQYELDLAIDEESANYRGKTLITFPLAALLSAFIGYISLSYEILWIRVYSFISGGNAITFAAVLGFYLVGTALGAFLSRYYCSTLRELTTLRVLGVTLFLAGLLGYVLVPALSLIIQHSIIIDTLPWVSLVAGLLGITLPLLCHSAIRPDSKSGAGLSYIYFANIVGATLGSFTTGFILTDKLSLAHINLLLSYLCLTLALGVLLIMQHPRKKLGWICAGVFSLAFLFWTETPTLFHQIYEKLFYKGTYSSQSPFASVIENKNGIITVDQQGFVFGNGAYDGIFNTSLIDNKNYISRAYAISAFHSHPRHVLMIGLASGSWAQVIANNPEVEQLTVIEINPGYLQLISKNSQVMSLLQNPKVTIEIGDGRRWLHRYAQHQFDLIVMNTTWHWREHASNLLSVDFLQLARSALKPDGILYYNTTDSDEALHTAIVSFPYALRIYNCVAVSDVPILLNKEHWRFVLSSYQIDGKPIFNLQRARERKRLREVLSIPMQLKENFPGQIQMARIITDDNMGTEWNSL